jgi:hypothetical protein
LRSGYNWTPSEGVETEKLVRSITDEFFRDYDPQIGPVLRHLESTIRWVDDAVIDQPQEYVSILRAQLSVTEVFLLFYRGLAPDGAEYKVLIERYGLMKYLPPDLLMDPAHRELYHFTAWLTPPRDSLQSTIERRVSRQRIVEEVTGP